MKKRLSLLLAVIMAVTCLMVPASAFAAEGVSKAEIKMFVYDKTDAEALPTVVEGLEVSSDAAEKAGYTFDDPSNSGKPTVLDAFVTYFGDNVTVEYNEMFGSASVIKLNGIDYPACGYYVNNSSDPTQLTCDTMQLKSGDLVTFFMYKDAAGWSDKYMFFDKNEYATTEGETLEIKVSSLGYDDNWNTVAYAEGQRTVVISDGTESYEAVSGTDGVAVFESIPAGEYTATVKLLSPNEMIVMPYAEVVVEEADEPVTPPEDEEVVSPEDEGKTDSQDKPAANDKSEKSPKTGDDFNAVPFMVLALISLTVGGMTFIRRRA